MAKEDPAYYLEGQSDKPEGHGGHTTGKAGGCYHRAQAEMDGACDEDGLTENRQTSGGLEAIRK